MIVVHRCDHSGCVDWYKNLSKVRELITNGGSAFHISKKVALSAEHTANKLLTTVGPFYLQPL